MNSNKEQFHFFVQLGTINVYSKTEKFSLGSRPLIPNDSQKKLNCKKAFEMSHEDIMKRKARLEAEKTKRGNNRNNFSSMF